MSKRVTYKCDLCRDEMPAQQLDGFRWTGANGRWEICDPKAVEFPHICRPCGETICIQLMSRKPQA
jgi:hypothetical protein